MTISLQYGLLLCLLWTTTRGSKGSYGATYSASDNVAAKPSIPQLKILTEQIEALTKAVLNESLNIYAILAELNTSAHRVIRNIEPASAEMYEIIGKETVRSPHINENL